VLVGQRLVTHQFHHEFVPGHKRVRKRVDAYDVLYDCSRNHRHASGVRVVRIACARTVIKLIVGSLEEPCRDELALAGRSLVPQAKDQVRVGLIDSNKEMRGPTPCIDRIAAK
jgi:hypothetical protein